MACTILGRTVCSSMVTFLQSRKMRFRFGCRSRCDALEARIVVGGVIAGFRLLRLLAAAHDAPCAAVPGPRRRHGVLAVVAPFAARQQAFAVAEDRAGLAVRKRTTGQDQPL